MTGALDLSGHVKDLGGAFTVRRLLPDARRQSVGPFVFFDHFGPTTVNADTDDVRPHPHIGLATVTYLLAGRIRHRDSLGTDRVIEPGAINWMTAGRGVVHSERWAEMAGGDGMALEGLQLWAALPIEHEEAEPDFSHTAASAIPETTINGADVRVLIGEAFGLRSPVPTFAPTLYLDVAIPAGHGFDLPALAPEQAVYVLAGSVAVDDVPLPVAVLRVLQSGQSARISNTADVRLVVIGGAPLESRRHMWWNFVSSRRERIAEAAADWAAQRLGRVPGESDFIPLPPNAPSDGR
jgi:redox-sensitive bicupin YhaK (pirin superfamily)